MSGDSWHSCIVISESSFIFADEMNYFRHFHTSSAPCLKGFKKYQVLEVLKILVLSNIEGNNTKGYRHLKKKMPHIEASGCIMCSQPITTNLVIFKILTWADVKYPFTNFRWYQIRVGATLQRNFLNLTENRCSPCPTSKKTLPLHS